MRPVPSEGKLRVIEGPGRESTQLGYQESGVWLDLKDTDI